MITIILEYFAPLVVFVSIVGMSLNTITYAGFTEKYFLFNPFLLFGISILLNYLIIVFDESKNYWWNKSLLKLLQRQSLLLFPTIFVIYVIFLGFEYLNYPNYVFSKFHFNLTQIVNVVWVELFLAILPTLVPKIEYSLKEISKQLRLKKEVVGICIILLFCVCFGVILY